MLLKPALRIKDYDDDDDDGDNEDRLELEGKGSSDLEVEYGGGGSTSSTLRRWILLSFVGDNAVSAEKQCVERTFW